MARAQARRAPGPPRRRCDPMRATSAASLGAMVAGGGAQAPRLLPRAQPAAILSLRRRQGGGRRPRRRRPAPPQPAAVIRGRPLPRPGATTAAASPAARRVCPIRDRQGRRSDLGPQMENDFGSYFGRVLAPIAAIAAAPAAIVIGPHPPAYCSFPRVLPKIRALGPALNRSSVRAAGVRYSSLARNPDRGGWAPAAGSISPSLTALL